MLKKHKSSLCAKLARSAALLIIMLAASINILATDSHEDRKLLLILNSYGENERMTQQYTNPIIQIVAQHKDIECQIEYFNNVLVVDSTQYNIVKQNILNEYKDRKPSYVVFVGNMAFSMREEVAQQWGKDIPMLLITRNKSVLPAENYFSGFDLPTPKGSETTIADLRSHYNLTALIIPYNYQATLELMMKMIPDMHELIFISDNIYLSRVDSKGVHDYLLENYPGVRFKWLKSSARNSEILQEYFVTPMPNTGFLMATWGYEGKNALGYPTLLYNDINLITGSVNPIFTLHANYVQSGAVGGVFNDEQMISKYVEEVMDKMLNGASMRDIPIIENINEYVTTINYRLLERYKLSDKGLPSDTVYFNKPRSFLEKYLWEVIIAAVVFTLLVTYFWRKNKTQRKRIRLLERHQEFVRHMPIPYSKAVICYNNEGTITNINYTIKNEAFQEIIRENAIADNPFLLFPADFIAEKTTELIRTRRTVRFVYHFDTTNTYYEFRLCLIAANRSTSIQQFEGEDKNEIDIFAINITDRYKSEIKLKEIAKKMDLTLNMAGIIPWDWDITKDVMTFDAYSLFERREHEFDGIVPIDKRTSLSTMSEFYPLINKEDLKQLREIREKLLSKEISQFSELQYRISVTNEGIMTEEWVEVAGLVTKRDKDGNPLFMSGSMMRITDPNRLQINKGGLKVKTE